VAKEKETDTVYQAAATEASQASPASAGEAVSAGPVPVMPDQAQTADPAGGAVEGTEQGPPASADDIPFHPATAIYPLLEGAPYEALKEDMRVHGQLLPSLTHEGQIIDGRNRYRANKELGRPQWLEEWKGSGDVIDLIVSLNEHRRHLTDAQRSLAAARAKRFYEEAARQRMLAGKAAADPPRNSEEGQKGESAALVAKKFGVSADSVYQAQTILRKGVPELQKAVDSGEVSLDNAAALASEPEKTQKQLLQDGLDAVRGWAKDRRQRKRAPAVARPQASPNQGSKSKPQGTAKDPERVAPEVLVKGLAGNLDGLTAAVKGLVKYLGPDRARIVHELLGKFLVKQGAGQSAPKSTRNNGKTPAAQKRGHRSGKK
jgi:hypothetical protein